MFDFSKTHSVEGQSLWSGATGQHRRHWAVIKSHSCLIFSVFVNYEVLLEMCIFSFTNNIKKNTHMINVSSCRASISANLMQLHIFLILLWKCTWTKEVFWWICFLMNERTNTKCLKYILALHLVKHLRAKISHLKLLNYYYYTHLIQTGTAGVAYVLCWVNDQTKTNKTLIPIGSGHCWCLLLDN